MGFHYFDRKNGKISLYEPSIPKKFKYDNETHLFLFEINKDFEFDIWIDQKKITHGKKIPSYVINNMASIVGVGENILFYFILFYLLIFFFFFFFV